ATFTNSALSTVSVGGVNQTSGTTANNFTNPVTYKITAEDASIKEYVVTVTITPASRENTFLTYLFDKGDNGFDADAVGTIDTDNFTIEATVPWGTDLTTIVASFTVSDFATVHIGGVPQVSGTTPNDFTNPVNYTIVAQDGSSEIYTITVSVEHEEEKHFNTYAFANASPTISLNIDNTNRIINISIPYSSSRLGLIATFTLSAGVEARIGGIVQVPGVTANDFDIVVVYTLVAADGSTIDYQVTVTNAAIQTGKKISDFSFNAFDPDVVATIVEADKTIDLTVPLGTNVTALVATFTKSLISTVAVGGAAQTSGTTANDFTNPVSYVVTAENGDAQTYTVTVTITPASSEKEMTYFAFEGFTPDIIGVINQASQTVSLTLPNGTDRTALVATFTTSPLTTVRILNQGIQQSALTVNDYTNPLTYEVYAQDGTQKNYVVTVYETNDVTAPVVTVITIDGNNTNANQVTNELGQFALLQSNEASGKVYIIEEDAPQTTVADLEASVAAGKGRTVWVQLANTNIPISTYAMDEGTYYAYAIDAASNKSAKSTIAITIDDELAPTVIIAAQTISNAPSNSVVAQSSENEGFIYLIKDDVAQTTKGQLDAAVAAKNGVKGFVFAAFTNITLPVAGLNPGDYHAYAVDNNSNLSDASSQIVVITAASRLKSMSSFSFQGTSPASIGHIAGILIDVEVPYGTSLTALVASFTISEKATAYIGLVEQVSGVTANNFTNPVTYTVEAEDGTTLDYVMTVTVASGTGINDIQWVDAIQVYPNPVQDQFSIEMLKPVDRVIVIDLLGQIVADIDKPGTDLIQISTQSWTPGLFIVRFYRQGETVYHSNLIKQ
ncbi:MAG: T9SS type A sorting domain-containing protein, partial [Bacteroidota bacterium]|nr:T9SS type A sorting domain-containing protein [Bacteroidota bacterium]